MAHRHRKRAVRAGMGIKPFVGKLGVVRIVGGDRHHFLAPVACLSHEVCVGSTGDGNVGAPHDEVGGIEPVSGFRHVCLVTKDLRRCDGQIAVPVVERHHRAAHHRDETGSRRVRGHRHCGDGGEAEDAVRAVLFDRVHVGGGDDFFCLRPAGPHKSALAARLLVPTPGVRVGRDGSPCVNRVRVGLLRFAVGLE